MHPTLAEILRIHVRITRINKESIDTWKCDWCPINFRHPPDGGWDWELRDKLFKKNKFLKKYVFSMATWAGNNELCGLTLGKRSRGNDNLSLYYIEGSPNEQHSLKGHIFDISYAVAMDYAKLNHIKKIKLIEPIESLIPHYEARGFVFMKKRWLREKPYCLQEVTS